MERKQFCIYLIVIGLMASLAMGSVSFAGSEITGKLKSTIDKVIAIVTDENLKKNKQSRRVALRKAID